MDNPLITLTLRREQDTVPVRQLARQLAGLLGFGMQDQSRIATAVSEIARNALRYGGGGQVEFRLTQAVPPELVIRVHDHGPGIADLPAVLEGRYRSTTGLGLGIVGARRLMDRFDVETAPGAGTCVTLAKTLSARQRPFSVAELADLIRDFSRRIDSDPVAEIQQQNTELLRTLEELNTRQDDLARLNRDLEDTNRGVVALYAELDDRADHLQQSSELKSRFLSNMSHELRTPLNSIISLAQILLGRLDGGLTDEQERQVQYIERAAETLSDLVGDLLDLAKVEAGRVSVQADDFRVCDLFGALRGMLRPLLARSADVTLTFVDPDPSLILHTDEGKISQILRNLVSNALKYTERGEVRVSATNGAGDTVVFTVADTGIGISPEDEARIFDEFAQVDNVRNSAVRGTGLGLPLSRRLAHLLGGVVVVDSAVGRGSTFQVVVPRVYAGSPEVISLPDAPANTEPPALPVIFVEESAEALFVYGKYLEGTPFRAIQARSVDEACGMLREDRPAAVVLSLPFDAEAASRLVAELRACAGPRPIPVLGLCAPGDCGPPAPQGVDACAERPVARDRLLRCLSDLVRRPARPTVLIVDDEEVSRYILHSVLDGLDLRIVDACGVDEALLRLHDDPPDAVILDLVMPQRDGRELLRAIRARAGSRDIPVIINTSSQLTPLELDFLVREGAVVVSKQPSSGEAAGAQLREAVARAGVLLASQEDSRYV